MPPGLDTARHKKCIGDTPRPPHTQNQNGGILLTNDSSPSKRKRAGGIP